VDIIDFISYIVCYDLNGIFWPLNKSKILTSVIVA
jgi:hypothetical protein